MFYFDDKHPSVLFCDNREDVTEILCDGRMLEIRPDLVADVTCLPFDDGAFPLVVFDPPYMKDEFVKRPAPKVLDADGVEIKVGDTVYPTYGIYQGILSNVLDADDEAAILIDVGNSFEKYARTALTHELPVFDANGERICKGDTVWDLDSGERLHVEEFVNRECGLVQCSNEEDGDCEDHDARRLTHREPDSLEKLRDDLYTLAARDDGDIEVEIVIFADRLTALIERGA